jgi:glutathione-S-conjugate glycine hydrolase
MNRLLLLIMLSFIAPALADVQPNVIYWNSPAGKALRARMPADADYWQLAPVFVAQKTQSYCSVASAVTVLNALPIKRPVDPIYAPYAYFTQRDFFTPAVSKIIDAKTVLAQGMTRAQMAQTLRAQGVHAESISGATLDDSGLRTLLQKTLVDDGHFVLANYLRQSLGQVGGGHWSALAAYDAQSDRVLILDVAKYKYAPAWVGIDDLRRAIATFDTTSGKSRGLVIVSK